MKDLDLKRRVIRFTPPEVPLVTTTNPQDVLRPTIGRVTNLRTTRQLGYRVGTKTTVSPFIPFQVPGKRSQTPTYT